MTLAAGFWAYFSDQRWHEVLLIGVVAAGVYAVIVLVPATAGGADRLVVRGLVWSAATLQIFVVSLTLYEAVAEYYRSSPPGSDAERQGEAFADWQFRARFGFVVLYVVTVALAAGGGFALASRRGAVTAAAAVLGFMLVTSWFVAYMNTCEIGYGWADFPCT